MFYLPNGTWQDAEDKCNRVKGHLWSINSYTEWWNVVQILGMGYSFKKGRAVNIETFQVITSVVSFVGLKTTNQVRV